MKTALIALTPNASALACLLASELACDVWLKPEFLSSEGEGTCKASQSKGRFHSLSGPFPNMVRSLFAEYQALVFIMATGIVVRSIASCLVDKKRDPAVLVLDEAGHFVISLLSGHSGGANDLARRVAAICGGQAVITTATDVNGLVAFDEFARRNDCAMEHPEAVKAISTRLLKGGTISLFSDIPPEGEIPGQLRLHSWANGVADLAAASARGALGVAPAIGAERGPMAVFFGNRALDEVPANILLVRPRNLILGIGCRKGTPASAIAKAIDGFMAGQGYSFGSLRCLATIGLKAKESGLLAFCAERGLPLEIVDTLRIKAVESQFAASEFVRKVTGVGAVAEPAAVLAGRSARLVVGKTAIAGISLALAEDSQEYHW